ncbi:Anaerobic glycerol-3-phosphate dehydrogenase subunit C [Thalassocella blandensis]|nr:Anaerobic glycerol-3-phosphate dehydrogenase subunit C [Thalassocella blandensis]
MIPKLKQLSPVQQHYLDFLDALKNTAFKGDISPDYANRTVLATDNSIYQVLPQGIIYPADSNDLILLCQLVNKPEYHDIVISPRGGGTGTNGQSLTDGIVVDVSKHMNNILEINIKEKWVRVEAGVVKDQLNAALKPHGLFFAPELSTSNRATIGGMINTDASGQGSCVYGKTRDHVLELQTVLVDGSVIKSHAMNDIEFSAMSHQQDKVGLIHRVIDNIYKENRTLIEETFPPLNRCLTGYDLAHIRDEKAQFNLNNVICGSEGTLGFVCEAKLNVLEIPRLSALVVVKYKEFQDSLRDATELMKVHPTSIETIDSKVLNLAMGDFIWNQVEEFFDGSEETPVQGINLVEFTANTEAELREKIDTLKNKLASHTTNGEHQIERLGFSLAWGHDAVNRIWAMRKRAVGLLGNSKGEARPVPFVEDTAVPPEHLADFILEFREILDAYQLEYGMFGHVDAGVLHVRPALDMKNPAHEKIAWEISDRVAELTYQYHGLLWGEHGKGVRSEYAPQFFGKLYPQLQRIKSVFDPYNQLNPGKIATPSDEHALLKIDEVTTRGQLDREIPVKIWEEFSDAVYCNGNGACFNWNTQDAMCPSWKATRERIHSPKGRASLIREWIKHIAKSDENWEKSFTTKGFWGRLNDLPEVFRSSRAKRRGEYDFSHEVYDSMAGCLACKSCAGQCPIKVNVPEFRSQFLELYHTRYLRPLKDYLVASLETMLPWCAKFPRLYNGVMQLPPVKFLLDKVVGFVDGPSLSGIALSGHTDIEFATPERLNKLNEEQRRKTLVLVQDAFTSYFETQLILDTVSLLRQLGFTPLLAPFKANGKPLHVHGFLQKFRKTAQQNATMLNSLGDTGVALVGIDPSMTLTYRSEYQKYLPDSRIPTVHLLQDWLVQNLVHSELPAISAARFKLMPHCTEKTNAGNAVKNWQKVFEGFGHQLDVVDVGCCGMSGTYGHESRNKENSKKIYELSWRDPIARYGDQNQLVATGFSCRSQVKREDKKQIPHPVQALLQTLNT